MDNNGVKITRALLGVSDKAGLADLARALARHGVEILSTGGTKAALESAGVHVKAVEDFTGFPEILDGRVKTLHPKIHGGILARRSEPSHQRAMAQHGLEPIDLVVVNFYPFEQTVARKGVTLADAIENIDIGGPTLVRSARLSASRSIARRRCVMARTRIRPARSMAIFLRSPSNSTAANSPSTTSSISVQP